MSLAVFAYGSLVNPESFARTLGREPVEPLAARLSGWRRRWSLLRDNLASEKKFARHPSGELPRWVVGLNLERDEEAGEELAPNGALIEISEAELERLDVRELRYNRVDVTGLVREGEEFDRIVTYTARPKHFSAQPPDGAVAMAPYMRAIEAAFKALGDGQWELFLNTTGPPPVETIEPLLVRDEIPPGNPREW
ncbi:MAG TPA: gamma-glutamylcyclotransferase family protein [Solirubrobacterales bacterium]|jgi:cation transport regulator ChaC